MSGYDYSGYYGQTAAPAADAAGYQAPYQAAYQPGPPGGYGAPPPYGAAPGYGAPAAGYGAPPGAGGSEEIRTIFITGFPADVKDRELNNMMRFIPGYEAAQMTWKNGQAQGFALFSTGALARAACDMVTQHLFDADHPLRCEMARKNMYIKADTLDINVKRPRTGPGGFTGASSYAAAPSYGAAPAYRAPAPAYGGGGMGGGGGAGMTGDNPPCNTLFVGNLSETVNEAELNGIFATQPGFRQLKVVRGRTTTAFVEYDTVENASKVHDTQQGAVLASNDRGGIRIQYSRNPFGKKRDVTGVLIDTPVRNPDYAVPGTSQ